MGGGGESPKLLKFYCTVPYINKDLHGNMEAFKLFAIIPKSDLAKVK